MQTPENPAPAAWSLNIDLPGYTTYDQARGQSVTHPPQSLTVALSIDLEQLATRLAWHAVQRPSARATLANAAITLDITARTAHPNRPLPPVDGRLAQPSATDRQLLSRLRD